METETRRNALVRPPFGKGPVNVLAIDGEPLQGAVGAELLQRLVVVMPDLLDAFDLLVSASAGCLLVCLLASGMSPDALGEFYAEYGSIIWTRDRGPFAPANRQRSATIELDGLRFALQETFGARTFMTLARRVSLVCCDSMAHAFVCPELIRVYSNCDPDVDPTLPVTDVVEQGFATWHNVAVRRDGESEFLQHTAVAGCLEALHLNAPVAQLRLLSVGIGDGEFATPTDVFCRRLLGDRFHRLAVPAGAEDDLFENVPALTDAVAAGPLEETAAWLEAHSIVSSTDAQSVVND